MLPDSLACMPERYCIGIDLGGTKTEVIVLSPTDEVLLRKRNPTPKQDGYEAICQNICNLIEEGKGCFSGEYSIGIGIPGILNPETGRVVNANTTVLIGKPLQADLERMLGHPVAIENDANCFILAESRRGAAAHARNAFGVIMGTGTGGGILMNGQIYRGRNGIGGEWGHFSIDPDGAPCWCGNKGCIETLISGSGLERQYTARSGKKASAADIVKAARAGEEAAQAVFDQFLTDFGRALGGLVSVLDPDIIVLGGGLSNVDELYTEGVRRMKEFAFHPCLDTPVVRNRLGDSAGVFGAAYLQS